MLPLFCLALKSLLIVRLKYSIELGRNEIICKQEPEDTFERMKHAFRRIKRIFQ